MQDIDFKKMKRGGVLEDGRRMMVFDHPDLGKTGHVSELRCKGIGERGALSLAAEFIRGTCPMVEVLDLHRCQIQTRGLGRLLYVYSHVLSCLQSYGYFFILLVSYVMWSGALEILDLLLSHLAITLAYHVSIILISTFKH